MIESMTFYEYQLRMTAYSLKRLDEQYLAYVQAFANRAAKATKKDGKRYEYKDAKDAFPIDKMEAEILGLKRTDNINFEEIRQLSELNRKGGVKVGIVSN